MVFNLYKKFNMSFTYKKLEACYVHTEYSNRSCDVDNIFFENLVVDIKNATIATTIHSFRNKGMDAAADAAYFMQNLKENKFFRRIEHPLSIATYKKLNQKILKPTSFELLFYFKKEMISKVPVTVELILNNEIGYLIANYS